VNKRQKAILKYAFSLNSSEKRVYNSSMSFNHYINSKIIKTINEIIDIEEQCVDALYQYHVEKCKNMGFPVYKNIDDINSQYPSKEAVRKEMYRKNSKRYKDKPAYKFFHNSKNWEELVLYIERLRLYKQKQNVTNDKYFDCNKTASVRLIYNTNKKDNLLSMLYDNYIAEISERIYDFNCKHGMAERFASSKEIHNLYLESARWKQLCYKQASELFFDLIKTYKVGSKEIDKFSDRIDNIDIVLDERFFDIREETKNGKIFNFIEIMTPIRKEGYKNRFHHIRIPYKPNKYIKKLMKQYEMKKCIKIYKNKKGDFYIKFLFYKNETKFYNLKNLNLNTKEDTVKLCISPNYENFMTVSSGDKEEDDKLQGIIKKYDLKLKRTYILYKGKEKGSKASKNIAKRIENIYRELINKLKIDKYEAIVIEDFEYREYFNYITSGSDKFKFKRWNDKFINILREKCKENGVFLKSTLPVNIEFKINCKKCGNEISISKESTYQRNIFICKCGEERVLTNNITGAKLDFEEFNKLHADMLYKKVDTDIHSPVRHQSSLSDSEIKKRINSKQYFNHIGYIKYLKFIKSKGKIVAFRSFNKLINNNYRTKDNLAFYNTIVNKAISGRVKKFS